MDVVAMGELLIDFTCVSADSAGYPTMEAHPGGAPANYLAALASFGAETALIGKVGADAFGDLLVKTLEEAGISDRGVVMDRSVFTTLAFVTLDEKGDRAFSFARKPGADTALSWEEVDRKLIEDCRVFHFGTLSLTDEPAKTATVQAVEYAKQRGKLISFDPNMRKPLWDCLADAARAMEWGLKQADVVKISDEEVEFLFHMTPEAGGQHILSEFGPKLIFVTCGEEGCYYCSKNGTGWVPALAGVKPVDTTGAGDMFGGSAMWKLLQLGKTPENLTQEDVDAITRFATAAAGLSTQKPGGISSVPTLAEVERAIDCAGF